MRRLLSSTSNKLYYLMDSLVIVLSMVISWRLKVMIDPGFSVSNYQSYIWILLFGIVPLYLILYFFFDLYSPKRGQGFGGEFARIIEANLLGFAVIMCLFFSLKLQYISRAIIFQFAFINMFLVVSSRYFARRFMMFLRSKGYNQKNLLLIGAGSLGGSFIHKLQEHREYGYRIIAVLDDDPLKAEKLIENLKVVGGTLLLEDYLKHNSVDEVIIALPLSAYKKMEDIIDTCERQGVKTMIIPDYYKIIPAKPKVIQMDDLPLISIRDIPLDETINRILKRSFDIVGSLVLIFLSFPLMLFATIGVKLSSRGPVLFKQERVGLNRKTFNMYKFRSMRVSTNIVADTTWTREKDPRRTKFGEFLRVTSLDELPQFFNVLMGDMSLIGPRPERPYFVEKFKDEIPKYMVKHQVKPGITGWAQVNGWRGDTSIEERIKCDIYYIENWTLLFDIKIIILTLIKGILNKNAY